MHEGIDKPGSIETEVLTSGSHAEPETTCVSGAVAAAPLQYVSGPPSL